MKGRKAKTDQIKVAELEEWIAKDINRSLGVRCQALIALKKKIGVNIICKVLGISRECLRLWRKTVEAEGFIKHPKTGRKSELTEEIRILLKEILLESPEKLGYKQVIWDGKLICKFLEEKKQIIISVRTAQNWLKKIGFTRQKPRKKYKKGDDMEIEAFKKR